MDNLRAKVERFREDLVGVASNPHTARNVAVELERVIDRLDEEVLESHKNCKGQTLLSEERLKEFEAQEYSYGMQMPEKKELVRGYRKYLQGRKEWLRIMGEE